MLEILHRRHNALEEQETLHGRRLDTALRDEFRHLNYRFSSLLNDFVSWKRVAPDRAMRELLKAKRALDNLSPDPEFDLNLTIWTDSLRYGGVYNAMYAPERLDPRQLHDTQQQVALYKQLLRRAAVGLRRAFEVNTSPVGYARSLLARASEYISSSMRFAGTYKEKEPASLGEVVNLSPPRASDANEYFSPKVVDLSPPRALDAAEHFLVGQGYIVTYRSVTTLIAEREDHKSVTRQEGALKLLVIALPQPEGGVRIKVRGKARKGVGELQARWTGWIASLPTRQPPPTVRVKVVPMERSGRLSGVRRILSTDVILALVVFIALLATLTMVGLAISLLF